MLNTNITFLSDTISMETLLEAFFKVQADEHVKAWRWHCSMVASNPNYLEDIAERQAKKRAAGIGVEGMCHG